MAIIKLFLLILASGLIASPSHGKISGQSCKKHFSPIFELQTNHLLAQDVYGAIPNAVGVPMENFNKEYQTDSDVAKSYIIKVREIIRDCKQFCEGLLIGKSKTTVFQCDIIKKRSIADFSNNIDKINDDDTTMVVDTTLDDHFNGVVSGEAQSLTIKPEVNPSDGIGIRKRLFRPQSQTTHLKTTTVSTESLEKNLPTSPRDGHRGNGIRSRLFDNHNFEDTDESSR